MLKIGLVADLGGRNSRTTRRLRRAGSARRSPTAPRRRSRADRALPEPPLPAAGGRSPRPAGRRCLRTSLIISIRSRAAGWRPQPDPRRARSRRRRRPICRGRPGRWQAGAESPAPPWSNRSESTRAASRCRAETRGLPPAPPRNFAWATRRVETSSTPRTRSAARAAWAEIGVKPSLFWITSSPWKLSSTAVAIELLIPAAKTVTKTTTASPIISAAAVTAVLDGLRWVFSRASRPVSRRSSSRGRPATEASGRTRRGLKMETARITATAPMPISSAASPPSASVKRPARTRVTPAPPRIAETAA